MVNAHVGEVYFYMHEAEVNEGRTLSNVIPKVVLDDLRAYRDHVVARTVLPWGEHCTECVWPSCYSSCDLYEPRPDGGCRQFTGGVVLVSTPGAVMPYLQGITFRRWAKLWTPATIRLQPLARADRWESLNTMAGRVAAGLPAPRAIKQRILAKVGYVRRESLLAANAEAGQSPDCFVMEVYNPGTDVVGLSLSIWSAQPQRPGSRFQRLVTVPPGFLRTRIPFDEIARLADMTGAFQIEVVPNDAESINLYFGLLEFVKEREPAPIGFVGQTEAPAAPQKCKCVVWDLDNTIWSGTLIEDGLGGIKLKPEALETIKELDRRGILQSIASKNNWEDVRQALEMFGIDEYFLYPQVHWSPKSQSIGAIAKSLNIDAATFVFVDDQPFERAEVVGAWPQVSAVDGSDVRRITNLPMFDVPVTAEAASRRLMYRQQERRDALEASYNGDYLAFLRDNQMRVRLAPLSDDNFERVFELAQRTNQMNFSGNRYSLEQLRGIRDDVDCETYVIRCDDRFGSYGIVGFAVVERNGPRLVDLMFSCRVQSKRVEHGFLAWLLSTYRATGKRDFLANYRKTAKNAPSGAVFQALGFEEIEESDGVTLLRFPAEREIPDECVVTVTAEDADQ